MVLLLAGTATIKPSSWLFEPADPANATAGVGPAWYLAFLDGALRLAPGWEVVVVGQDADACRPAPGSESAPCSCYSSPATRSSSDMDHPPTGRPGPASVSPASFSTACSGRRPVPTRLAIIFHVSVNALLHVFQVLLIVGPPAGLVITRRLCLGLQAHDEP